ncbi:Uncharacterised protein [Mycolicibacterium aurum]|uniref:Uncharacterized protein n=1 Tax=Mycolicibacterium aurum TaxID=1791 RepID=A0A3S4S2S4_MYCAU|nr:TolC family protein [Mycolicibacterium aurum]VEG58481.1 Uncharacterised protein [Mycolicibacterium aurum]
MGFAVEEALDRLYAAKPEDFTAVRGELTAAAKDAGDRDAAARIGGARKPTAAAWVVNALTLGGSAKDTLSDLGSRLREAHGAMDGEAIRALTAEQRKVVDDLTRTAMKQAGIRSPSAALRDDVTATLQAAIADPDVAGRLGRLTKAEQWSGFGEFVFTASVSTAAKKKAAAPKPEPPARPPATDRQDQKARAAVAAAERAKADADRALGELQSDLSTARLRRQDAQRRLAAAEQAMAAAEQAFTAADDAYTAGKKAAKEAAEQLKTAKRGLRT